MATPRQRTVTRQRNRLLDTISRSTDKLMIALALVWIGLTIAELLGRLNPALEMLQNVIWALFALDFAAKLFIAPRKLAFLRTHWIALLSLLLPAFRLLRVLQALGALRALSLVRVLAALNGGIGRLSDAMGRRGIGYVSIITVLVLFGGAGGMYAFERPDQLMAQGYERVVAAGGGLHDYGDALWWTAMLMTTIGSQYWPVTAAGRALCIALSLFSLGVFGYITAALASFFVDKDKAGAPKPARDRAVRLLTEEVRALRDELRRQAADAAERR
jgi:voltage-gated potassium channel